MDKQSTFCSLFFKTRRSGHFRWTRAPAGPPRQQRRGSFHFANVGATTARSQLRSRAHGTQSPSAALERSGALFGTTSPRRLSANVTVRAVAGRASFLCYLTSPAQYRRGAIFALRPCELVRYYEAARLALLLPRRSCANLRPPSPARSPRGAFFTQSPSSLVGRAGC